MSIPKYLAQGTFGCVHRPRLRCKGRDNFTEEVSKIMNKADHEIEIQEYEILSEIDPKHQYHLGNPTTCTPQNDLDNLDAIRQCDNSKEIIANMEDYRLILMKDGGNNIAKFADEISLNFSAATSSTSSYDRALGNFWVETFRLILGIELLIKSGYVHHDLKAQNVVYDQVKRKVKMIDFGKMEKINDSIRKCKGDIYEKTFHWSYPFETVLLNSKTFYEVRGMGLAAKRQFIDNFRNTKKVRELYSYESYGLFSSEEFEIHMIKFTEFIMADLVELDYNKFLIDHFQSVDIYGAGLAFLYVLNKTKHLMSNENYIHISSIVNSMVETKVFMRPKIERLKLYFSYFVERLLKSNTNNQNTKRKKSSSDKTVKKTSSDKTVKKKRNRKQEFPKRITP